MRKAAFPKVQSHAWRFGCRYGWYVQLHQFPIEAVIAACRVSLGRTCDQRIE